MSTLEIFRKSKILLISSFIIGLFIALMSRSSFITISNDFRYVQVKGVYTHPPLKEFDRTNMDKKVFGLSGFPFSTYTDCKIGAHGTFASPACEKRSLIGELSILLNTVFWSGALYLLLTVFRRIASSDE